VTALNAKAQFQRTRGVRSLENDKKKSTSLNIWMAERIRPGEWSEPVNLGNVINTNYTENYPSVDEKGNLFFFSCRKEGLGGCEIYTSKFYDGKYQQPELLNEKVNSDKHDWDPYIAKDGSFIIFSSQNREDSIGKQDLYISYKNRNGDWTEAVNMGPRVNSTEDEICPSISPDGEHMFFTTRRRGHSDIFWIDSNIIEELKPDY